MMMMMAWSIVIKFIVFAVVRLSINLNLYRARKIAVVRLSIYLNLYNARKIGNLEINFICLNRRASCSLALWSVWRKNIKCKFGAKVRCTVHCAVYLNERMVWTFLISQKVWPRIVWVTSSCTVGYSGGLAQATVCVGHCLPMVVDCRNNHWASRPTGSVTRGGEACIVQGRRQKNFQGGANKNGASINH